MAYKSNSASGNSGGKTLWDVLQANAKEKGGVEAVLPTRKESHILFVGAQQSGKTTLLNSLTAQQKGGDVKASASAPKATAALDYKFSRRTAPDGGKSVLHMWELGGGREMCELIDVVITPERLPNTLVCITVDLSEPEKAFDDVIWWIDRLKLTIMMQYAMLKSKEGGEAIAHKVKKKAYKRAGKKNVDLENKLVDPFLVPLFILPTKYDKFEDLPSVKRKVLLSSLRYVAHSYAAHIFCTTKTDSRLAAFFRNVVNSIAFGTDKKRKAQFDPSKPLIIPAGSDAMKNIPTPGGSSDFLEGDIGQQEQERIASWRRAVSSRDVFPAGDANIDHEQDENAAQEQFKMRQLKDYGESEIDAARAQKDLDLEQYIREAEQRRKLELLKIEKQKKRGILRSK